MLSVAFLFQKKKIPFDLIPWEFRNYKVLINLNRGGEAKPVTFNDAFENHGILGSGAFSDVFKAKDRKDGVLYVKCVFLYMLVVLVV